MFTNTDVTIYFYRKSAGKESYQQTVVEDVFWDDVKQSNVLKTGQRDSDSVLLVIPFDSIQNPLSFTTGKDIAVKGKCEQAIDCTDQKSISESLVKLKAEHHFVTITSVDEKLYGSEEMWHYELSCK